VERINADITRGYKELTVRTGALFGGKKIQNLGLVFNALASDFQRRTCDSMDGSKRLAGLGTIHVAYE
jgi:hypothetical protein